MIDHQSQMAFATKSIDAVTLRNNAAMVAKAAAGFKVSTILTTVAEKTFSGPIFDEIKEAFPGADVIDRTSMNTWEDGRIAERVNQIGKNRLVFAGLWTSRLHRRPDAVRARPGLRGLRHRRRLRRRHGRGARARHGPHGAGRRAADDLPAVPAGAAARLGPHRDLRARTGIAKQHGGGYGLGIIYAKTMFGGGEDKHVTGVGTATKEAKKQQAAE